MPRKRISIPTGTIKSENRKLGKEHRSLISIPTGTIKRSELTKRMTFTVIRISIPTGTIKRKQPKAPEVSKTTFQFLLVRLKAETGSSEKSTVN